MCEILFRGKRKDNGELVYGYYAELPVGSLGAAIFSNDDEIVCEDTASYIIKVFEKQHSNYSNGNPLLVIECENYEVIPETVGRYTGLTDKNGKKIFEGDMIKPFDDEIDKMVVEFRHGQFLLCLYGERGYMAEYGWEESGNYGCFEAEPLSSYGDNIEVIGNIHDDPELLKGGD